MLGRFYEKQDCSAARTLELVGERWSLLILRDAMFRRHTRFSEFERSLDIAPNILAKRLSSFVEAGLMESPQEGEYHLTGKGSDLKPIVIALTAWGDKWISPGPVMFVHDGCEGKVEQQLRCVTCAEAPRLSDVVVRPSDARRTSLSKGRRSSSTDVSKTDKANSKRRPGAASPTSKGSRHELRRNQDSDKR